MYYVLHTKVLKCICLSIFTLRLLNNNSINVIPEQAFFYHRKIEILWVTTYLVCFQFSFGYTRYVPGDILMVVHLWFLRNCFHKDMGFYRWFSAWKTILRGFLGFFFVYLWKFLFQYIRKCTIKMISFLTTNKKQSLAKPKSMILYHDCSPWTTNDREQ